MPLAISSGVRLAAALMIAAVPARSAACAAPSSPVQCATPVMPVGDSRIGTEISRPAIVVVVLTEPLPVSTRGTKHQFAKASRLACTVLRSSAPPLMKVLTTPGRRRDATFR